jgi:DNA-binding LacI/PurR family transcriptional regulator
MNAIQQAGLRVPDDVSVVEFDGAQAAMGYTA